MDDLTFSRESAKRATSNFLDIIAKHEEDSEKYHQGLALSAVQVMLHTQELLEQLRVQIIEVDHDQ